MTVWPGASNTTLGYTWVITGGTPDGPAGFRWVCLVASPNISTGSRTNMQQVETPKRKHESITTNTICVPSHPQFVVQQQWQPCFWRVISWSSSTVLTKKDIYQQSGSETEDDFFKTQKKHAIPYLQHVRVSFFQFQPLAATTVRFNANIAVHERFHSLQRSKEREREIYHERGKSTNTTHARTQMIHFGRHFSLWLAVYGYEAMIFFPFVGTWIKRTSKNMKKQLLVFTVWYSINQQLLS